MLLFCGVKLWAQTELFSVFVMEENKPQEGEPAGGEGEGKPENIAQLASEHIPKEVATTPSGLRLGGRPLVHSIHGTVFVYLWVNQNILLGILLWVLKDSAEIVPSLLFIL